MELEKCGVSLVVATAGRLLVASITPVNLLLESGSVSQRVGVVLNSRLCCSVSSGINGGVNYWYANGLTVSGKGQFDAAP